MAKTVRTRPGAVGERPSPWGRSQLALTDFASIILGKIDAS